MAAPFLASLASKRPSAKSPARRCKRRSEASRKGRLHHKLRICCPTPACAGSTPRERPPRLQSPAKVLGPWLRRDLVTPQTSTENTELGHYVRHRSAGSPSTEATHLSARSAHATRQWPSTHIPPAREAVRSGSFVPLRGHHHHHPHPHPLYPAHAHPHRRPHHSRLRRYRHSRL